MARYTRRYSARWRIRQLCIIAMSVELLPFCGRDRDRELESSAELFEASLSVPSREMQGKTKAFVFAGSG